jgi:hypothetical protein
MTNSDTREDGQPNLPATRGIKIRPYIIGAVTLVALLIGGLLINEAFSRNSTPPNEGEESATASDVDTTYGTVLNLCDVLDLGLYEETVGQKSDFPTTSHSDSGDVNGMSCNLESGGGDNPVRAHHLNITAEQRSSEAEAQAAFDDSVAGSQVPQGEMEKVEGSWDHALEYSSDDWHVLTVQDDNLTIVMGQSFSPPSSIDLDSAKEMMRTYAEQISEALRR